MAIQVETRDCAALTDADLDDMASMGGAFDIGVLSKAKEDWVLCTTAKVDGKLHGFTFSTLERIGGTPCVLLGLMSVKRTSRRDQVLKGLMAEAFHRALMAFPDEDVVVGSRFVTAGALEAFRQVDELIPRPGHRAVGEERAWGRRLAKRFGVDGRYDEQTFAVTSNGQSGYLDHEELKPERVKPDVAALFDVVDLAKSGALVVHGWVMAEDLVKLGRALTDADVVAAVVRRRRMTRNFIDAPVDADLLDPLLDLARRAPSAGFSQGVHFVVLRGTALASFWDVSGAREWFAPRQPGVLRAPVVVLTVAEPTAYTERYSEPDKHGHGLHEEQGWPVPYWLTDTAMATQNLLLLCEANGLGALFFGLFRNTEDVLAGIGAPAGVVPVGAVAIGHRHPDDAVSGSARTRRRLAPTHVVHHDHW